MRNSIGKKCLSLIILDFDGVIVESNHIKDRAFVKIFREYPDYYKEIMFYHYGNNAIDRYEKFKYFVENILNLTNREDLINKFVKRFNNFTQQAIIDCPYVTGALEFLDSVYKKYPLYLVSATPNTQLIEIIKARKLDKYFKQVYGAPQKKSVTINKIISIENILPDETLFIGDSLEDLKTANFLNIQFIGRKSDRPLDTSNYPVFKNMKIILRYIKDKYELLERTI